MPESRPIDALGAPSISGSPYPEPFASLPSNSHCRPLASHFGLTQLGVGLNTLNPGEQSGLRHWHTLDDEFIFVLDGSVILETNDGEFCLSAGMCMGFKAQDRNAHLLFNRSEAAANYLIIGSRVPGDVAHYPDDDLAWLPTPDGEIPIHKDGTPYPI